MIELFVWFLCVIQAVSIIITVVDKTNAIKGKRRIREKTLMLVALFGGAASMYITMLLIRHKTKHLKFMLLLPVMIVIHILLIYFVFCDGFCMEVFL
ncbi:MAG: DUF1294 domain-containing protein [Acutalibacteraceae bacterium]|nr:DUF1294 domain-containing protein [Acutalibacteraceae bacterium]